MKSKQIFFILSFILLTLFAIGQKDFDQIKMKNGTTYIGEYISKDSTRIRFINRESSGGETVYILLADIDKMTLHLGEGREKTTLVNSFRDYKQVVKEDVPFRDTGFHLKRGGRFGIAGVAFVVTGSIFSIVGAIKGIPGLAYTGAAVTGLGGIFLIVPFGQMIRAGNKYPKPAN